MKTIVVTDIRIPVEEAFHEGLQPSIEKSVQKKLGTAEFNLKGIHSKSLDARRKGKVCHVIAARVEICDSFQTPKNGVSVYKETEYGDIAHGSKPLAKRPVIAGSGPCGLFCAFLLARHGYRPIVVERGKDVEKRTEDVARLWRGGELDPESNAQFGEGGAGAFSDGKLITRINDPRCGFVTDTLIRHGAPGDIAYEARPHVGTDRLRGVVASLRSEIENLGGEFLYETKMTGIRTASGVLHGIEANGQEIDTDVLVAAVGHSARDTYRMFFENGVDFIQKPFSAGVRIEHLQKNVDYARLGEQSKYVGDAAEYMLSARPGGRGVYTFCMCPGGNVINAASEQGMLVVNGMSNRARAGENANSAWVVEVGTDDFGSGHPLAGIEFQRELEKNAFSAAGGGFRAPVQLLDDFLQGRKSEKFKAVKASYTGGTRFADLNKILPKFIVGSLKAALPVFGSKLKFFKDGDAVLTGSETRTSAPVRMTRNSLLQSTSVQGLYPAGEGAGYAGGIMSSAVDGLRVAESIIKLYNYRG